MSHPALTGRGKSAALHQPKLGVEALEDRRVPATLVGLTANGMLATFDSATPTTITRQVAVSGLRGGDQLIGIDYRPATGQLYGVGSGGRIYTLNSVSGVATIRARLAADPADTTSPFTAIQGTVFGVDFNPVPDRLRLVSNTGQNLRINVDTGLVTTDTPLAYGIADTNAGAAPAVVGSAYTNPDNDPVTLTTLYDIDFARDALVIQNPPNDGTLTTVGGLNVDSNRNIGFDIDASNTAYATLSGRNGSNLYTVNLATGAATVVGRVGASGPLLDVAVALPTEPVFAVTASNNLIGFNAPRPDVLTSKVAITGLRPGEVITAIDFRPATGRLYGLGTTGRVYSILPTTGVATRVFLMPDPADTSSPFTAFQGASFGFDFNPVVDRLRVVSDADQNSRVNIDAQTVTTDTALAFAAADTNNGANPNVIAAAYTNNVVGATSTTLFGIDSALDVLLTQAPPNDGTLNTVGSLGINVDTAGGFDISANGTAYAAFTVVGGTSSGFYTINLTTGAATLRGTIAGGELVVGLAVARPTV